MKAIEVHLNGKLTDLRPVSIEDAQELGKKLIGGAEDVIDIYTVEKQHIISIKKQTVKQNN